jgi:hypothetical protein
MDTVDITYVLRLERELKSLRLRTKVSSSGRTAGKVTAKTLPRRVASVESPTGADGLICERL